MYTSIPVGQKTNSDAILQEQIPLFLFISVFETGSPIDLEFTSMLGWLSIKTERGLVFVVLGFECIPPQGLAVFVWVLGYTLILIFTRQAFY